MTTIKEFIKENSSPNAPKKKKRRVRLKNFNPFRKRNYKKLNEDHAESDQQNSGKHSSGDSRHKSPTGRSDESTKRSCSDGSHQPEKRRGPWNLLNAARGSFGLTAGKGNPDDPNTAESRRKRARRHDSTECLIDQDAPVPGAPAEDRSTATNSPPESSCVRSSEKLNYGSGVRPKQLELSDEIEVIETETKGEETATKYKKKKKKSKKKRLKKAGIKTAKMLGHGLSNMAMSFQYMSPEAAVVPVAKEFSKRREDRYRELSTMAYITAS